MKSINNFIIEKLKINSNTKINNELVEDIFYKYWGFVDEEKEIINVISQWVNDNNIEDVKPIADKETLAELDGIVDDSVKFDSDETLVEKCQKYLEKSKSLYVSHNRGENIDIMGCEEMICILDWYGAIYCVNSKITNK